MSSIIVDNAKTLDEILKSAVLKNNTNVLYFQTNGYNSDADANIEEDIWTSNTINTELTYLTIAVPMYAVSTDADDTAAGTGARTLEIRGLDQDYNPIKETIIMDGTTDSANTTQSFLRVHRGEVLTAGSSEGNEGAISINDSVADTLQNRMASGRSLTGSTHFTIPAGYTGIVVSRTLSLFRRPATSGLRNAEINFKARKLGGPFITLQTIGLNYEGTKTATIKSTVPIILPPKTDIKDTIVSEDNNSAVNSQTNIILALGDYSSNLDIL